MRHKRIKNLIAGGALIGAFLITTTVFAYNQDKTHPALTDEIVDFYNLNFPQKLSNQDKNWIVRGSIDEDQGMRPMNHFYDPVYNRGIAGFSTSKQWAMSSGAQSNFAVANKSIAESSGLIKSNDDFSYERAMDDYSRGDRQRAMTAFGHLLHLLEDMGVPDHTRNDPHPPVLDWGSPYEYEMAKWNPGNLNIASELKKEEQKPVDFDNLNDYFDKLAKYTNVNFFSKDTISNVEYKSPNIQTTKNILIDGSERLFIVDNKFFPLAFIDFNFEKGKLKAEKPQLTSEKIGSYILDGYWDRLSKEVVLNGAGALNLLLTEAEKAKTEYVNRSQEKPSWFARLLGLIGIGELTTPKESQSDPTGQASDGGNTAVDNSNISDTMVTPSPKVTNPSLSPTPLVTKTPVTNVTTLSPSPSPSVSPSPSPISSPGQAEKININTANKELLMTLKGIKDAKSDAIILHRQTHGPFQKTEDIMNVSGIGQTTFDEVKDLITVGDIVPTPSPVFYASGGGGGSSSTPTPTPSPSMSPLPTPTPSVSPTPTPSPTPDPSSPLLQVVINEIAWMGTASSSNDEWLELYNTTNQTIDLTGWTLKSLTGTSPDPQITLSGTIQPFGFYLLERTDDTTISDISADKIYTGALSDAGETLELRDNSNTLQDKVSSDSEWYAGNKDTRSSMERIDPKQSGNDSTNWVTNNGTIKNGHDAAGQPINGTPKAPNSGYVALKPSAVTNLFATINSPFTITWSAPEDLDTLPASLSYDLRYSLANFPDDNTWDMATKIASSSLPSVGEKGASQSASFDVVHEYGQTLYFALKTKVINITTFNVVSPQSNVATVSFPTAVDTNAWAMLGKDQYHSSFAANIAGPGSIAAIIWEYDAESGNTTTGTPIANVFRSNQISAPCTHGGDYFKLYLGDGQASYGFWPCAGGTETWAHFNTGFNNLTFTELEFNGNPACGTFQECSASALSVMKVVLRADDWIPTGSINNAVVSADGDIYFGSANGSGKLVKLDKNGVKQWEYETNVSIGTPAVLSDEAVYFGRIGAGGVLAFTALNSDGSKRWDFDDASSVKAIAVSSKGEPHFTYSSGADKLSVLNTDGSVKVTVSNPGLSTFTPVVLEDGTVITTRRISGNQLFNAYSADGTQLWSEELFYTGANGSMQSNPSYDKTTGKTYSAIGHDGGSSFGFRMFVIPPDGSALNTTIIDSASIGSGATMVSITPTKLFVGLDYSWANPASGSKLFSLNKSDLMINWSFQAEGKINQQIAVDKDGNAYFSTQSGHIYSVDQDGHERWHISMGIGSVISPVLTENGVIWGYGNWMVKIE